MTKEGDFTLNEDEDEDEEDVWDCEDCWNNDQDEVEDEGDPDVKDESAAYLEFLQEEVAISGSQAKAVSTDGHLFRPKSSPPATKMKKS